MSCGRNIQWASVVIGFGRLAVSHPLLQFLDFIETMCILAYLNNYPHVRQAFYKSRSISHPASANWLYLWPGLQSAMDLMSLKCCDPHSSQNSRNDIVSFERFHSLLVTETYCGEPSSFVQTRHAAGYLAKFSPGEVETWKRLIRSKVGYAQGAGVGAFREINHPVSRGKVAVLRPEYYFVPQACLNYMFLLQFTIVKKLLWY